MTATCGPPAGGRNPCGLKSRQSGLASTVAIPPRHYPYATILDMGISAVSVAPRSRRAGIRMLISLRGANSRHQPRTPGRYARIGNATTIRLPNGP